MFLGGYRRGGLALSGWLVKSSSVVSFKAKCSFLPAHPRHRRLSVRRPTLQRLIIQQAGYTAWVSDSLPRWRWPAGCSWSAELSCRPPTGPTIESIADRPTPPQITRPLPRTYVDNSMAYAIRLIVLTITMCGSIKKRKLSLTTFKLLSAQALNFTYQ